MLTFSSTIKGPFGRTEVSIVQPSGLPKEYMSGTALNSVIYLLPINTNEPSIKVLFLKALREAFPEGQGLGLIIREYNGHHVFEMVLPTDEDCDSALNRPVSFELRGKNISYSAITPTHPSLELYKVELSKLPLQSFDTLKTLILEALSKRGTVLDIVLYKEDFSKTWFMGNGYVIISRKKMECGLKRDPAYINFGFPCSETTQLSWSKIG